MAIADFENFYQLDIRVGEIIDVQDFIRARNPAYKVQIKFSENDIRWSSSQITQYNKDELLGMQVTCIVNLQERNIAGFMSQVFILGVPDSEQNTILLKPDRNVENGAKIF